MYQTAITVANAVDQVESRELVLPAIQRELVWEPEQIENIWDSMMRGYPIGSFLFWSIPKELTSEVRLYDFMTDFDVRARHNPEYDITDDTAVVAVLDGQQRLSAMNIGLRGSYRTKLPRMRWDNEEAFVYGHVLPGQQREAADAAARFVELSLGPRTPALAIVVN